MDNTEAHITNEELVRELEELRYQLSEANETIDAIRSGQVDALVVQGDQGHQLFTLKSADQTYRVFIEKMTEGAVTVNREGYILYCNSQFASMVQTPLSSVFGLRFEQFIAEDYKEAYTILFNKCWSSDCKGEVCLSAGSNMIPVQLSLATLDLNEGISLSIILTDLTAQKKTQQQLRENNEQLEKSNRALEDSNHDLQQFASVASHDLQEPLRKIQVFSNLLIQKKSELSVESGRYLEKIVDSCSRMRNLIIDVLNYSKLSASNNNIERVDLDDLVSELIDDFELVIHEKKAKITLENLPAVEANKGQIRQVFQNLISNALKFTKAGVNPEIVVSSKTVAEKTFSAPEQEKGPYSLITIRDNGIGFEEKYADEIFTLFERLHSKDKYEGTGIGLAITKKIIEKHNGRIAAHSNEGEGAEFSFILPILQG